MTSNHEPRANIDVMRVFFYSADRPTNHSLRIRHLQFRNAPARVEDLDLALQMEGRASLGDQNRCGVHRLDNLLAEHTTKIEQCLRVRCHRSVLCQ